MSSNDRSQEDLYEVCKDRILLTLNQMLEGKRLLSAQAEAVRSFLSSRNDSYTEFSRKIPILCKQDIFGNSQYMRQIIQRPGMKQVIPSAGTSATGFSFRIQAEPATSSATTQGLLSILQLWKVNAEQTLFVNAYPMGVSIPPQFNSITVSVCPEIITAALKTVAPHYQNIVYCIQPHFLKEMLDQKVIGPGAEFKSFFIIGGEWTPMSFSHYVASSLGEDFEAVNSRIISTYGVAELGLGIGIQFPEMNRFRVGPAPMSFVLNNSQYFLESLNSDLVITLLQPDGAIPMIRYRTGDSGRLTQWQGRYGFSLDCRKTHSKNGLGSESEKITVEKILSELYARPEVFSKMTGNFKIEGKRVTFGVRTLQSDMSVLNSLFPGITIALENDEVDEFRKPVFHLKGAA